MEQVQVQKPSAPVAPGAQTMTNEPVEPKKGGVFKWVLLVLAILIVIGGLGFWILR